MRLPVPRETVEAIPFSTLGFRYGNSPQAFISLAHVQGDKLIWISSDKFSIATRNGRIVRTTGFPQNLTGEDSTTRDPLTLPHAPGWESHDFYRMVDFQEDHGFSHRMKCSVIPLGPEEITILGTAFTASKYEELCEVETLKWRFRNTHWLDQMTGFVWRTRQWVHPDHKKPIELEVLRPSFEDQNWAVHSALKQAIQNATTSH